MKAVFTARTSTVGLSSRIEEARLRQMTYCRKSQSQGCLKYMAFEASRWEVLEAWKTSTQTRRSLCDSIIHSRWVGDQDMDRMHIATAAGHVGLAPKATAQVTCQSQHYCCFFVFESLLGRIESEYWGFAKRVWYPTPISLVVDTGIYVYADA
jgi:hypothetical protein